MKNIRTHSLFHLNFVNATHADVIEFLNHVVLNSSFLSIATPNPEQIIQAKHDAVFEQDLQKFDIRLPDGQGVVWAATLLGAPLRSRITGIDVVRALLENAVQQKWKVMIVGGKEYAGRSFELEGIQKRTEFEILDAELGGSDRLEKQRDQQVAGGKRQPYPLYWVEGYRQIKNLSSRELTIADAAVLAKIMQIQPQIVFVAFGAPHQEMWVNRNREELEKMGVNLVMVVGGAFDVLSGKIRRAPKVVQQLGFEWLFRLAQEPWRWKRQLRLIEFVKLVMQERQRG